MSSSIYRMNTYCNRIPKWTFPVKIDLGAGQYPVGNGFLRVDFDANGADLCWDLTTGIPLPNDSVSDLYTSHFLEHLIPTDYHYMLQEMYRVCQSGATVTIRVPHGDTPEGKLPCHYNLFTEDHMRAIAKWFPPENGSYWDLRRLDREGIHLIAVFVIVKA